MQKLEGALSTTIPPTFEGVAPYRPSGYVTEKGNEEGIFISSWLGSLGERRKLPQWGLGRKRVLIHFELDKNIWCVAI